MPSPPSLRYLKRKLKPGVIDQIKSDLTFSNRAFYQAQKRGVKTDGIPQYFYGFQEYSIDDKPVIEVPCFIDWDQYGLPEPPLVPHRAEQIDSVTPHVTYRANQREAARALDVQLSTQRSGILSLACGKGKTVLSVAGWAAMERPVPAIAITTTRKIAGQWMDRLREFTDITEDDIGYIGEGKNDWRGKKFVVAIINTLALQTFPDDFYKYFGVVFFDECHRLGAPFFSTVARQFHGVRIGLSATWERSDGLEQLFMLHLGPVFFEDRTQAVIPDVYFAETPIALDLNNYRMWKGRGRQGDVNHAKVITELSRNTERHDFIMRHVLDAHMRRRKVLVLSDRKEELLALLEQAPDGVAGICVGSLDGRSQSKEIQDEALAKPIVLATTQLVKEGLDKPDIDTLFILYAQSNASFAEQAAGRILRQLEGKQPPVIVVMNDRGLFLDELSGAFQSRRVERVRPFQRICKRMQENFERLGYNIKRPA